MANARNGVDVDEIDGETIIEHENHTTAIFPDTTAYTCILTAHATAHTFTEWAEIVDSDDPANSLSDVFASYPGHITAMLVEEASVASALFMVEIAYGASYTIVSRSRVLTETNKLPTGQIGRFRGALIPAGETVYYRVMSSEATAPTITVHFRAYLHD